ncbi:MAG TPA: YCF48-related protein [Puia sp.]
MRKKPCLISMVVLIILWTACSKDHPGPHPTPAPQDSVYWTRINTGLGNIDLSEIYFTDSLHGFIAASDKYLYASSDGGRTWIKVGSVEAKRQFLQFFFLDKQHGYAIGRDELAFTFDEGQSWTVKPISVPSTDIWTNVQFTSLSTGFITTGAATYKTTDTGSTWHQVNAELSNGIYFTDQHTGYAFTRGDSISKTTDGGDHWQPLSLLPTSIPIAMDLYNVLQFTDTQHGWMMDYSTLCATSDAGGHWTKLSSTSFSDTSIFTDFQMVNNQTGWLATPKLISKTENGGVDWEKSYDAGSDLIISINFIDDHYGWVGCQKGILLKYHR